jgi:hypothetical protein
LVGADYGKPSVCPAKNTPESIKKSPINVKLPLLFVLSAMNGHRQPRNHKKYLFFLPKKAMIS